jgi:hypothetical protein
MTTHREHLEAEIYLAIKAWLECAPEKRPSPQARLANGLPKSPPNCSNRGAHDEQRT